MPKTITKTVYLYSELSDKAKEKARDWFIRDTDSDNYPADEICDSLKALFKACSGVKLTDWSIGGYSPSYVRVSFDHDAVADFTGSRALAWLENNLLQDLRLPYRGPKRWQFARYGASYRPRMIKPCPFTGVYYDEDFLDELRQDVTKGIALGDAFKSLADRARRLIEAEYDYRRTEEHVSEMMEVNEYTFDENGRRDG